MGSTILIFLITISIHNSVSWVGMRTLCTDSYEPCKHTKYRIDNLCVWIYKEKREVADAMHICKAKGQQLVEIHDDKFHDSLIDILSHVQPFHPTYFINLHWQAKEQDYSWGSTMDTPARYQKVIGRMSTVDMGCVKLDVKEKFWKPSYCSGKNGTDYFVCTGDKPSTKGEMPKVYVQMDALPSIVFIDKGLKISCTGKVGTFGTYSFIVWDGQSEHIIPFNDSKISVDERFEIFNGTCRKRQFSSAIVHLPTETLPSMRVPPNVTCILQYKTKIHNVHYKCGVDEQLCATSDPLQFYRTNEEPVFNNPYHGHVPIVHVNRTALIECSACIWLHGVLEMHLEPNNQNSKLLTDADSGFTMTKTATTDCSVYAKASYRLKDISFQDEGLVIYCTTRIERAGRSSINVKTRSTDAFRVEYGPETPVLEVAYHEGISYIIMGWEVNASCTACLGYNGHLTLDVLDSKEEPLNSTILANITREYTEISLPVAPETPECVKREQIRIRLKVKLDLHKSRLVCRSMNISYPDGYVVEVYSNRFHVPTFRDHYHPAFGFHLSEIMTTIFVLLILALITITARDCLLIIDERSIRKFRKGRRKTLTARIHARKRRRTRKNVRKWQLWIRQMHWLLTKDTKTKTGVKHSGKTSTKMSKATTLAEELNITVPEARKRIMTFKTIVNSELAFRRAMKQRQKSAAISVGGKSLISLGVTLPAVVREQNIPKSKRRSNSSSGSSTKSVKVRRNRRSSSVDAKKKKPKRKRKVNVDMRSIDSSDSSDSI